MGSGGEVTEAVISPWRARADGSGGERRESGPPGDTWFRMRGVGAGSGGIAKWTDDLSLLARSGARHVFLGPSFVLSRSRFFFLTRCTRIYCT